jgi:hypothetical protein
MDSTTLALRNRRAQQRAEDSPSTSPNSIDILSKNNPPPLDKNLFELSPTEKQTFLQNNSQSWFDFFATKIYNFCKFSIITLACYCVFLASIQDRLIYMYPMYSQGYSQMLLNRYNTHPLKSFKNSQNPQNSQTLPPAQLNHGLRDIIPILYTLAQYTPYITQSDVDSVGNQWWDFIPFSYLSSSFQQETTISTPNTFNYEDDNLTYAIGDIGNFMTTLMRSRKDSKISDFYSNSVDFGPPTQPQHNMTMFYIPPRIVNKTPFGEDLIHIDLSNPKNTNLFSSNTSPPPPQLTLPTHLVVLCGGNGMLALDYLPFLDRLGYTSDNDDSNTTMEVRKTGFLLIDFPGYGFNGGTPSPATTRGNVAYALQILKQYFAKQISEMEIWIRENKNSKFKKTDLNLDKNNYFLNSKKNNIFPLNTHFFGFSLGCTTSLSGALSLQQDQIYRYRGLLSNGRHQGGVDDSYRVQFVLKSVSLDSPFSTMTHLVSLLFKMPQSLVSLLLRHNYDNVGGLEELHRNQIVLYGLYDELMLKGVGNGNDGDQNNVQCGLGNKNCFKNDEKITDSENDYNNPYTRHIPVNIIHSTHDDIIPYSLAQDLFLSAVNNDQKEKYELVKNDEKNDEKNNNLNTFLPPFSSFQTPPYKVFTRDELISDSTNTIMHKPVQIRSIGPFFTPISITEHKYIIDPIQNIKNENCSSMVTFSTMTNATHNEALSDEYALLPYKTLVQAIVQNK